MDDISIVKIIEHANAPLGGRYGKTLGFPIQKTFWKTLEIETAAIYKRGMLDMIRFVDQIMKTRKRS